MAATHLILADNNKLLRTSLKAALENKSEFKVVGETDNSEATQKIVKELKPQVVLLNAHLPETGSLELIPKLTRWDPDIKIIVIAPQNDPFLTKYLKTGALGCLTKDITLEEMIQAIRVVNQGQRYMTQQIAKQIALDKIGGEKSPIDKLSNRESQVMMLVIQGMESPQIAEKLHMSPKTVCSYRYRIFDKLNVKNDIGLIHEAIRYGLLDEE
jgi:two-component system invasion response regulator UvrY